MADQVFASLSARDLLPPASLFVVVAPLIILQVPTRTASPLAMVWTCWWGAFNGTWTTQGWSSPARGPCETSPAITVRRHVLKWLQARSFFFQKNRALRWSTRVLVTLLFQHSLSHSFQHSCKLGVRFLPHRLPPPSSPALLPCPLLPLHPSPRSGEQGQGWGAGRGAPAAHCHEDTQGQRGLHGRGVRRPTEPRQPLWWVSSPRPDFD
jgi:hypothetical protein